LFCYEQTCSSGSRRCAFATRRIGRIAALIGDEAVKRMVDEAYEEYGKGQSEAWRVYLHGTEDERRTFRAQQAAEEAARAQEDDDRFYSSVLDFIAGRPHDILPGTVGMGWAETAKRLVAEDSALLALENKETLLECARER